MTTTNQLYVYIERTPAGSAFPFRATLKRGLGNGRMQQIGCTWGSCPDEALRNLHIDYWPGNEATIIYSREALDYDTRTMDKQQ